MKRKLQFTVEVEIDDSVHYYDVKKEALRKLFNPEGTLEHAEGRFLDKLQEYLRSLRRTTEVNKIEGVNQCSLEER